MGSEMCIRDSFRIVLLPLTIFTVACIPGNSCNSLDILVIPSEGMLTKHTYQVDPSSYDTVSALTLSTSPSKLPYIAKSNALS